MHHDILTRALPTSPSAVRISFCSLECFTAKVGLIEKPREFSEDTVVHKIDTSNSRSNSEIANEYYMRRYYKTSC